MIVPNHTTRCFLFVFALSLAIHDPLSGQTRFVNVREYGASGKASDNATPALRRALADCANQGGGTVYVPPGQYTTGAIELKDNVSLELDAGARILMSQDSTDYAGFPRTMIYAHKAKNIGIRGKGTLDGLARYEWGAPEGSDVEILEEEDIARKAGVDMHRALRRGFQGFLIHLVECEKVTIQDINLMNSTLWAMHIWGCNGVVIHGIDLSSSLELGVNSDGIDLNCTSNVLISDCHISTGDDAICIKTGPIDFKLPNLDPSKVKPSENIVVTNCILASSSTPLMIGTETAADIRHVAFSNCVIRGSNKGFGINIQDGANVSDILYSNLTMDLYRRHWNWWGNAETFYFVLKKRFPQSPLGSIKNVVIDNVISHAQGTSRILAPSEGGIENITISNLQLFMEPEKTPDKRTHNAVLIDGAKAMRISNLRVRWDETRTEPLWQSALYLKNVTGLEMEGFSGRQGLKASPTPAIVLENIIDGLIRHCRADEGTGVFLEVKGERTRRLHFQQNDLAKAREKKIIPAALTTQIQDEDRVAESGPAQITGPLVASANPNYFKDANGNVLILNGSQTWNTFQDWGSNGSVQTLDFDAFVQFLVAHGHNFTLLWITELPKFSGYPSTASSPPDLTVSPFPWQRTGPGTATDGQPKFDLRKFDPDFFDRLRARVTALNDAGIYVGVYLFTGEFLNIFRSTGDGYPFTGANNINGIDDGYSGWKKGIGSMTMIAPNAITRFQDTYVEKVIDALNDLPNVLWIVSEEAPANSTWWNDHQISHIRAYESKKPYQHPIGYAALIGAPDTIIYNSDADWVAPQARISPATSCGSGNPACKVNVNDSDHSYFGIWNDSVQVNRNYAWQNFMTGNQVLFMDPYVVYYPREQRNLCVSPINAICSGPDPRYDNFRDNLGYILRFSRKLNLARVTPRSSLCSTGYCLAQTPSVGAEYLVYAPSGGSFTVDLSAMSGERRLAVEWFDPSTGTSIIGDPIPSGSSFESFTPPFSGDAVLYLVDTAGHATSGISNPNLGL